ncbi:hypothetical protein SAMN05660330_00339 [Desulforhopalus singaporensis]|uniref:SmpA / OmlA family protein n=2 Tax=Desulforhopalus singaporensis TaxID=91360 RepID=A0A1H0JVQ1_9BACT|nr:hypothetical protein SAMN05660330_00339 [Desulforhopalus singaporensis]
MDNMRTIRLPMILLLIGMLLALSACYTKPVRHLGADVSLLSEGESTKEDVLIFLGDPDDQVQLDGNRVKWLYLDKNMSLMEKTPFFGKYVGAPEITQVVVTFNNGVVESIDYSSSDQDELEWTDDFPWQKRKE